MFIAFSGHSLLDAIMCSGPFSSMESDRFFSLLRSAILFYRREKRRSETVAARGRSLTTSRTARPLITIAAGTSSFVRCCRGGEVVVAAMIDNQDSANGAAPERARGGWRDVGQGRGTRGEGTRARHQSSGHHHRRH